MQVRALLATVLDPPEGAPPLLGAARDDASLDDADEAAAAAAHDAQAVRAVRMPLDANKL